MVLFAFSYEGFTRFVWLCAKKNVLLHTKRKQTIKV